MNPYPGPNIDPEIQQQIKEFNQDLLRMAAQQYQAIRQTLEVKQWQISNEVEGKHTKNHKRSDTTPSVLYSAVTSARHWLIEKLTALEAGDRSHLPIEDEQDAIDASYTVITPERKDTDHELTHSLERNERPGASRRPKQPDEQFRGTGNQRGSTAASDRGEHIRQDSSHRPTGD